MVPKVKCLVQALMDGVNKAHIIDGRIPHAVILKPSLIQELELRFCFEVQVNNKILEDNSKYIISNYSRYPISIVNGEDHMFMILNQKNI